MHSIQSPRIAFLTLGCAKNEVDSQKMKDDLHQAGYTISDCVDEAQVLIINTCSFIQAATEESIDTILDSFELDCVKNGDTKVLITGCMPSRYGEELKPLFPEAAGFVNCDAERDIVATIAQYAPLENSSLGEDALEDTSPSLTADAEYLSIDKPYAYVKISDGCSRKCSYCTIPAIRGPYQSTPYEEIAQQIDIELARGAKEIILIGQDTGMWGKDFSPKSNLASLLSRLASTFPETLFRVMYLQPEGLDDELLETMKAHANIARYFDVPLQHSSATVLRDMNRKGSFEEYVALFDHIRTVLPDAVFRTTLMVGFPGETEEDFDQLCDFVSLGYFEYVGIFSYSPEEGTPSAEYSHQVDEDTKLERMQTLRDISDTISQGLLQRRIGQSYTVRVEEITDGEVYARAWFQAPDVDSIFILPDGEVGELTQTTVNDVVNYLLIGE